MFNMNRVTLLGHAGRDPEIRTMQSGGKIATFSLATTQKWKRQDGEATEATEWHRIVVYGGAVEAVGKLVRKGAALLVEGRIAGREYRDKEGQSRRITEIVVAGPQGLVNVLSPRQEEGGTEHGVLDTIADVPGIEEAAMNRRRALPLAAMALAAVLGTTPAAGAAGVDGDGCDPAVREALVASAARGVEEDLVIIRHPDQGIRDPDSILDFSCLEDLFNYRAFNVLFDPGRALEEILGLAQRRVCEIARNAYRGYVGRTLDASVYTSRLPRLPGLHRLPGLDTDGHYGNILRDSGVNTERFRGVVGGGQ